MAKAILMSIKPKYVADILNGKKTIEIRKKFPKDYVGWVYIYCCKDKLSLAEYLYKDSWGYDAVLNYDYAKSIGCAKEKLNGKVVARFWCDNVEEIKWDYESPAISKYVTHDLDEWELCDKSCLKGIEITDYLGEENKGYAIHINILKIFDKPKEIKEFKTHLGCNKSINCMFCKYNVFKECTKPRYLTRAPQSYCYVEI